MSGVNSSIYIQICAFIYCVLLIVVYFNKKRYNSFEEVLSNLVTMIPEYEFSDDILMLSGKENSKYVNKILETIDGIDKANQNRIVSMIPVKIISISILFLCLVLLIILLGPKYL